MTATKQYTSKTGEPTSKTKEAMGIADSDVTIWAVFHLSPQDNALAKAYCKAKTISADGSKWMRSDLYFGEMLVAWFNTHREEIQAAATNYLIADKTEDQLEKELEAIARQTERLTAAVAAKKAATAKLLAAEAETKRIAAEAAEAERLAAEAELAKGSKVNKKA